MIEKNHRIFKERWGAHIRAMLTQPPPVAAEIPATLSVLNQINSSQTQQAIQGAILLDGNSETIIRGWLSQPGNPEARSAILKIDDRHDFEVQCNLFRKEIRDKVNAGRHGFELVVPLHLADGNPHQVKLIDRQTQKVVAEARQTWRINRTFTDFSGFLAHSLTMPLLQAPFRDEDRLCLAHMEKLADYLLSVTDTLDAPPKVSIVMPAYNRAGIIKTSVLSALNQYYTNLELLVVDDGSTDGTGEILSVFKDPRLKVLCNDRNRGQCYSLNRAIAEAKGEYIAYLDSDNTWDARYIAAMVGAFAKLPDADALYCGQYLFRGATDTPFAVRFGSLNRSLLANRNYIDRNAFMHKKAVHDRLGGYDGSILRYVDWDFIIRTSEKYAMYSVPVLLSMYCYDLAANTMTNDDSHLPDLDVIRANQKKRAGQQQRETAQKLPLSREISVILFDGNTHRHPREYIEALQPRELAAKAEVLVPGPSGDPETSRYLEDLASTGKITLVPTDEQAGFFQSLSRCVAAAQPGRDILLLSGRAALTPGAVQVLQVTAATHPDCAVVLPQQVLPPGAKAIRDHVPYAKPQFACDVGILGESENAVNRPTDHDGNIVELTCDRRLCVHQARSPGSYPGPGPAWRAGRGCLSPVLRIRPACTADENVLLRQGGCSCPVIKKCCAKPQTTSLPFATLKAADSLLPGAINQPSWQRPMPSLPWNLSKD